ncbi:uncharacterized protein LOC102702105 isoform X3 [Oryza brachyantha]|uniref:uncharacterized protein LOC102702105 isoform X3 n=1 Tax=Oryza brachyantha TaxID=4533 RepID=UPI00077696FF|nr:uncharacterized protein LOC102702105 isoform X3 [Oryza brachyantha]
MDVFLVSLIISLILLIGGSSEANTAVAAAIPSPTGMEYWQKLFPETPMPPAILDLLTPLPAEELKEVSVAYEKQGKKPMNHFFVGHSSNNQHENSLRSTKDGLKEVSVSYGSRQEDEHEHCLHGTKVGLKEVSVSYGSEGEEEIRKAFPMGRHMLNKEREKPLHTDKVERLKEVSVSYGSETKEVPQEEIPMELSMFEKEPKANLNTNKVGLKEVSVSHGSDGEDKPSKAFFTRGYMLGKKHEKSLHGPKDVLKEVSVTYGPELKLSTVLPVGYENHKYTDTIEGVKEVSVSYGSDSEEEPHNTFPTKYILDKEHENPLHVDREKLKEVSVSYGPKLKASNSLHTGYGHKRNIYVNGGLKEVSVSYGSDGEEEPHNAFPTKYMLDKEHENPLHVDKEELKEVSVSYGPKIKASNSLPIGSGHKKHIYVNRATGLKEVSVSYGSDGEEEPHNAFPTKDMLDKEHENPLHIDKEELKEVSVSYGPKMKAINSLPIGYGHKKYIYINGGLKEVSVSYGSDGEEISKAFPTRGSMLDKNRENSEHMKKGAGMNHRPHIHAHGNTRRLADVFFFHDALRPGSIITPTIPTTDSLPALLPRRVADSIPFSTDRFADIVAMFAPASLAMAREIRWALDTCQHPRPLPGEKAGCATSLESLAELAAGLLGTRDVQAFSAADLPTDGADTPAQRGRYNVTAVRELSAGAAGSEPALVVACHDLTYPYAVFYCHTTKPTAAYAVTLVAATEVDGSPSPARMEVLAVCHLDTSRWNPANPFFVAHSVKPGEVSVCHFLTKLSIVWVPRTDKGGPRANFTPSIFL